jgi:hypothetical protein
MFAFIFQLKAFYFSTLASAVRSGGLTRPKHTLFYVLARHHTNNMHINRGKRGKEREAKRGTELTKNTKRIREVSTTDTDCEAGRKKKPN